MRVFYQSDKESNELLNPIQNRAFDTLATIVKSPQSNLVKIFLVIIVLGLIVLVVKNTKGNSFTSKFNRILDKVKFSSSRRKLKRKSKRR
tara:strand:- start:365 stop:634 length:270 start_codon:yes stop_codon:yes gene_type:complete